MPLFAFVLVALTGVGQSLKLATHGLSSRTPYRQTLHNHQNVQYFGDLLLGGQTISGIFDTGSFELLVRSTRCTACVHPTTPYDWSTSTTYEANGSVVVHSFGSGPCTSMQGYETVEIGPMIAQHQSFYEIIRHQIPPLDVAGFAAIVGIGPNFASGNTEPTLLMNFDVTEFSICLQRASLSPGYLTWGAEVPADYRERFYAQAEVRGLHHWATTISNVRFQSSSGTSEEVAVCRSGSCGVIVDSGTSLIAAPSAALAELSMHLAPVMEDCSNLYLLPTLKFIIDGTEFALPPEAYTMRVTGAVLEANSIWDLLFFKPRVRFINMCMPAFMEIDMTSQFGPTWILGMPFFRYYHTTFDRLARKMYFAHAGPGCVPQPFYGNQSEPALASWGRELHSGPMEMDVKAMVPPRLSVMIDEGVRVVEL